MFSRVTEKELVTDKVYCSNSRWDFTMTPRKLFWYLGQIFFFNTAWKSLLQFVKIRDKLWTCCNPTV